MTWSRKQGTNQFSGSSSAARNLAFGSNISAVGNPLVVWVRTSTAVTLTVTDSQGNTYSQVGGYISSGTVLFSCWSATAGSAAADTVTVTPSGTTAMEWAIEEYSSTTATGITVDGQNGTTGSGTSAGPGSVSVAGSDDLSLCAVTTASVSEASGTPSTGYTRGINNTGNPPLFTAWLGGVSTTQSPTITLATTAVWLAIGVTLTGSSGTTLALGQQSAAWTNAALSLAGALTLAADMAAWTDAAMSMDAGLALGPDSAAWTDAALALAAGLALGTEAAAWTDAGLALAGALGLLPQSAGWNAPALTIAGGGGIVLQLPAVAATWSNAALAVYLVQACTRLPFVLRAINLDVPPAITLGGVCIVDNTESVSYYQRLTERTFAAALTLPNVLRRAATRDEVAQLGQTALVFHVWANQLAGTVPHRHDRLVDAAGFGWQVEKVEVQTFGTRYRLTCKREH